MTVDYLNQFTQRLIADALLKSLPSTWLLRAKTFEDARPKPGDFTGNATAEEIAERDARLAEQAELCRMHARLLADDPSPMKAEFDAMVAEALAETVARVEGVSDGLAAA